MKHLLAVAILAAVVAGQTGVKAPAGFRFPNDADYSGGWQAFRAEMPIPFQVTADFNGDGISDEAWLLPSTSDPSWALVVFLGSSRGPHRVIRLESDSTDGVQTYGIARVDPGRYETACGKGYWDCTRDEPPMLELKLPGLRFFLFEGASSIFWWDGASGRFKRTWISD
jgi:hypothetical protein